MASELTSFSFTQDSVQAEAGLKKGTSFRIGFTVVGASGSAYVRIQPTYTSSDPTVATASSGAMNALNGWYTLNGAVVGHSAGTAVITAEYVDESSNVWTDTLNVEVTEGRQVIVSETSLKNIADATRTGLSSTATYKPAELADAVAKIGQYDVRRLLGGTNNDKVVVPGRDSGTTLTFSLPSEVKAVGEYAYDSAFKGAQVSSVSAPSVETVESYGFQNAFQRTSSGSNTTIDFSSLTTAGYRAFSNAFEFHSIYDISFPELVEAQAYAFQEAFSNNCYNGGYTVSFPKLTTVGSSAFSRAFRTSFTGHGPETVDFSGLVTFPSSTTGAFSSAFYDSDYLTSVDFSSLETACESCFSSAFYSTPLPAVSFPSLTAAGESAFANAFQGCASLVSADFSALTTVDKNAFYNAFSGCRSLTSVDFSSLTTVHSTATAYTFGSAFAGNVPITTLDFRKVTAAEPYAFYQICNGNTNIATARFDSVQTASDNAFTQAFNGCTALTTANFDSLETVSGSSYSVFRQAFKGCSSLTAISFPALKTVSQGGTSSIFEEAFSGCTSLTTMSFPELVTLTNTRPTSVNGVFYRAFAGCTSLTSVSFPKLDASTFGTGKEYYYFNMLSGCTGVTVHFPASAQTEVEAMYGYPNFGGTNTTVLFDL